MRLSALRWAAMAGGALLLPFGAAAFACTNLATVVLSTGRAKPGATVTLTGASFAYPRAGSGQPPTTVVVHWQSETGPVLVEAVPDRFGSIVGSFTVPDARPGVYVLTAIQQTARVPAGAAPGAAPTQFAEPGTPARASFEVLGAEATAVVRAPAAVRAGEPASGGTGDLDSTVWIVLTAAFGAVALTLFGGGLVAFAHQSRRARTPAHARWIPPGW